MLLRTTTRVLTRSISSQSRYGSGPELVVEAECSWKKIGERVTRHGRTCLAVVGDETVGQAERCLFELRKIGINCAVFTARGPYPTVEGIDEAREMARRIGAVCIAGIGGGGPLDIAKATSRLHNSSGGCKQYLWSPSDVLMGEEGSKCEPRAPVGDPLPLIMVPTSAGAGAGANSRCLVWHPEDEILVPLVGAASAKTSVALVDPRMCTFLAKPQTLTMALVALSSCMDAMVAWEIDSRIGTQPTDESHPLFQLATNGIAAVSEGLPTVLAEGKGISARELLTGASLCAGQLSAITPAPPIQLIAQAAGSLMCRHSYPTVCATVLPNVVEDLLNQTSSFSGDADVSEAVERALSRSATILLGNGNDSQTLLSWLQSQQRDWLSSSTLSDLDSTITAKEVASNIEMLLALESDIEAADRLWSGRRVIDVAEIVVG